MEKENISYNDLNVWENEKKNILKNGIENQDGYIKKREIMEQIKQVRKQEGKIIQKYTKSLIIKILLIILLGLFLLMNMQNLFNSINPVSNLTKKIGNNQNISQNYAKNKIITLGFYDVIDCNLAWIRIKKGYFYDLPKYTNKFRWIFLAKNKVKSRCNKYTHLTFRDANNYKNLERAVKENKIDIIVQNEDENLKEHEYLLKLKKKYGIKLVQIMHEYYFYFLIQSGSLSNYNYKWKPLKNFDAIISSVPCQIYMYHLQNLNQSIYLPQFLTFDFKKIQPSKLETKNILMVGRISKEKQFELGIKAMAIIAKKFPDSILNIVGGFNSYTLYLEKLAKYLNVSENVKFYNFQQDIGPFYRNASLYFMTSSCESFSFVLAESKVYGLANIVMGKEYLVLSKKGSIVVKYNDYKTMAYEAIKLFSNITYLKEQGKAARESIYDFLPEKIDSRYINLYESLMNGSSREFFDSEYKKYIDEKNSFNDLLSSLELIKAKWPQQFYCLKFEDFLKPFESINLSFCPKK